MKCNLRKKLLLFSFMLYLILSVESSDEVNGTTGENVTVKFTFQHLKINNLSKKLISLYKDESKLGSCSQTEPICSKKIVFSDVDTRNNTVTLSIINLTLEDSGTYHVAIHADGAQPLILSNKIRFTVQLDDKTTEIMLTTVHYITTTVAPKLGALRNNSILIFFIASVIMFIGLLGGLLYLLRRTCPRKSADNSPVQNSNPTQQGGSSRAGGVSVSCVEYGELDFQNRPDDRVKPAEVTLQAQDGVEYAAIIFPQNKKQTARGRMRDVQQIHTYPHHK